MAAAWALAALRAVADNQAVLGLAGVTASLGGRYVMADFLSPAQQRAMGSPLARRVVLFCMALVATRSVPVAAGITFGAVVLLEGLLSERSRFCIVPGASARRAHAGPPVQATTAAAPLLHAAAAAAPLSVRFLRAPRAP